MLIPLNIVMTYPVKWTKYQVLRDFIQNFYDSTGFSDFHERFMYKYEERVLRMWVANSSFSYEWLLYIGASTKGDQNKAGYFGEGFKIASLCAVRDYHWDVAIQSSDWSIRVTLTDQIIDQQNVKMLAYDKQAIPQQPVSLLELKGIEPEDYSVFQHTILSFYYPENPLLGDLIWSGEQGAIYSRSRFSIPNELPTVYQYGKKGIVFCAYQMLGTNPFNLAVCIHNYRRDDRERRALYSYEVVSIFGKLSSYMDAETSMKMLIYLRRYWNSHSKKKIDIHSWSPIIDTLIYKISRDALTKTQFRKCFSHLLYTEKAKTVQQQNRRRQAKSWLANQPERYLLVKETFRYLDYSSLEDFCESRGGFVHGETPNPMQEHGFLILEKLTASVFPGFFVLSDGFPERRIIQNANAVYHGMAVCQRRAKPILNSMGSLLAKRNISAIYLKYTVFQPHLFFDALSTYIHEICHMFGSDSSQAFSLALTLSTEILLKNYSAVVLAEKQWISVMSEKSQVQLYDR